MNTYDEALKSKQPMKSVIIRAAANKSAVKPVDSTPTPQEANMEAETATTEEAAPETAAPAKPMDMGVMIGRQINAYWTDPEWPTPADLTKESTWVMRKNGLWNVRKNDVGVFAAHISQVKLPGFPEESMKESFKLNYGKIPYILWQTTMALFQHFQDTGNNEVYCQIYYSPTGVIPEGAVSSGNFFIEVPPQKVNGAHVVFKHRDEIINNYIPLLDAHSHNRMDAFFSDTDNKDELADRLFVVVGRLNEPRPAIKCSFVCAGKRVYVDLADIFTEAPLGETFPRHWLERIEIQGYNSSGGASSMATSGQTSGPITSAINTSRSYEQERRAYGFEVGRQMAHADLAGGFVGPKSDDEDRGFVALQRSGTAESTDAQIRAEVEKKTEVALEPILKSRNFLRAGGGQRPQLVVLPAMSQTTQTITARSVAADTTNKGDADVDSTGSEVPADAPFFRQTITGAKATGKSGVDRLDGEMAVWVQEKEQQAEDIALEGLIHKIRMAFQSQDVGGPVSRDEKISLFRDLFSSLDESDVQILADTMIESGHTGTMRDAIAMSEITTEDISLDEQEGLVAPKGKTDVVG